MELMSCVYVKTVAFSASESAWFLGGGTMEQPHPVVREAGKAGMGKRRAVRDGAGRTWLNFVLVG